MRQLPQSRLSSRTHATPPSAVAALWARDGVEIAGLFALLCLFWGFALYLVLQAL